MCSRGVGMSAASRQAVPSKISVVGTSFLSAWPPTTMILSPTTPAARGRCNLGSSVQLWPLSAKTRSEAVPNSCPPRGVHPPSTTSWPRSTTAQVGQVAPSVVGFVFGLQSGLLVGVARGLTWGDAARPRAGRGRKLADSPYGPLLAGLLVGSIIGLTTGRQGLWYVLQVGLLVELTGLLARALSAGERGGERFAAVAGVPRPVRSAIAVGRSRRCAMGYLLD